MFFVKDVIHTVGPTDRNATTLSNCYKSSLKLALEKEIKAIVRFLLLPRYDEILKPCH